MVGGIFSLTDFSLNTLISVNISQEQIYPPVFLAGVPPFSKVLKQAVRRNITRFPEDFMFELTEEENRALRSQNATLKRGQHSKYRPFVFTEQGVAMLSSVLNSERAIQVNILIMRAFTQLRQMLSTHEELKRKIEAMEMKYDRQFRVVFDAITQLIDIESEPKKKIYPVKSTRQAPIRTLHMGRATIY